MTLNRLLLLITSLLLIEIPLWAQIQNHYILGTNGLNSAVKEKGVNLAGVYTWYYTTRLNNQHGDRVVPLGRKRHLNVHYLQVIFSYFSSWKILGGSFGCQIDAPFETNSISFVVFDQSFDLPNIGLKLSDIYFEPVDVRWQFDRLYLFAAYGFVAPTGRFHPSSLKNSGHGDWGQMVTLASTYFFDRAQTFSFSFFSNYEIHSKKKQIDFIPGDNFCFEWGLGRSFNKLLTLGVVGYIQKQTTKDRGRDVPPIAKNIKDFVASAGPELDFQFSKLQGTLRIRYEVEFVAISRTQGQRLTALAGFAF